MERTIQVVQPMKLAERKLLRVAAYARVSCDKDAMKHSLAAQISYYNEYIQRHSDWVFAGIYADEAYSGTKDDRPRFVQLMVYQPTGSIYQVLSSEVATKHGLNVSACIFDELHTQPTRALFDVMTQGSGDARKQPLWFFLTTAGTDRNSICWEVHQKALDIIEGRKVDPRFYPVIFGLPDEADWTSEENWYKANPSLGETISIDKVRDAYRKALETPADENMFRQLRLNQWVKQSVRWMPMDKWDECGRTVDPYWLEGRPCYAGLDLSSTPDMLHEQLFAEDEDHQQPVRIILNSYGGSCNAAVRMYDDVRAYPGDVHIIISGTAASAATVLATAADRLEMTPGSMWMIHDPSVFACGNERDLMDAIEQLRACKESILNVYCRRCRRSRDDVSAMMSRTTWMDSHQACADGFVDGIIDVGSGIIDAAADRTVVLKDAEARVKMWFDRSRARLERHDNKAAALVAVADASEPASEAVEDASEAPATEVTPEEPVTQPVEPGVPVAQVQDALQNTGIPVMAGVWRATSPNQNPPVQYIVYSSTTTEDAHQDDGVVSFRTYVWTTDRRTANDYLHVEQSEIFH